MTAHSNIGASSMYRWSACPGSVRLSAGVAKKSSKYADEGSDAHELAAMCLRGGFRAEEFVDRHIIQGGRDFTPDAAMTEAVQVYLDAVTARTCVAEDCSLDIETKFDLSDVHPGCFGTADAVIWNATTRVLTVMDYKHGAGVPVKVVGNPQLQYYGLGALRASGYPAEKVRLVIVQPRCEIEGSAVREWEIDTIDLLDFQADLKAYAAATEDPNAPLNPGDHCRFCPAAALCPALANKAQEVARMEFAPAQPYDAAQLKLALDSREVIRAWLKALDEFAYAEAEAGRTPPGYKLVAKRAMRKWRAEGEVVEALQSAGIKPDVFYERSLRSPAQLEKLVDKKVLAPFIVAESSGHALVSEADKRPAIRVDAASEFSPKDPDKELLDIPGFLTKPKPSTATIFD
jgi:hypothetical protein